MAKALWNQGYRYRKNNRTVFGTSDLTFKKLKIAIFVDSEFLHGKDWETQKDRVKTNTEFWQKKIEHKIQRDIEVNNYLESQNWKVLRFSSLEIKKISRIASPKYNPKLFRDKPKKYNCKLEIKIQSLPTSTISLFYFPNVLLRQSFFRASFFKFEGQLLNI